MAEYARAQILLGLNSARGNVLEELNENARSLRLMSDLNRICCYLNQLLYWQSGRKTTPSAYCLCLCACRNRTGFISHFGD